MKEYKGKWEKYEIGNISFIKNSAEHANRKAFVDYAIKNKPTSILEIGAGECLEAQEILKTLSCPYSVCDCSDVFLEHANNIESISAIKGDMLSMPIEDKSHDLLYCRDIIEHSPDLNNTFKEMSRVSNRFYISMFKWKMKSGSVKSSYHDQKHYFTSSFNIDKVISLINSYGTLDSSTICSRKQGVVTPFENYRKKFKGDEHRTGDSLILQGTWN